MDLVSVIIPCFNHGAYIWEAINSILCQTYSEFEIIIIDDGSDDSDTLDILDSINHKKVKVFHSDNNGLSAARNLGVRNSNGAYLLFLDSDDYFERTFIEKSIHRINENSNIGAVSSYVQKFGTDSSLWKPHGGCIYDFLIENNACAAALVRRTVFEYIGGYDEMMKSGFEDWEFWIRLTSFGYIISIINEPLFYYRMKNQSMITESNKKAEDIFKYIIEKHTELYLKNYLLVLPKLYSKTKVYEGYIDYLSNVIPISNNRKSLFSYIYEYLKLKLWIY